MSDDGLFRVVAVDAQGVHVRLGRRSRGNDVQFLARRRKVDRDPVEKGTGDKISTLNETEETDAYLPTTYSPETGFTG